MAKTRKRTTRSARVAGPGSPQPPASASGSTQGTGTPQVRSCGTMLVHERLLRTDPAYMSARVASENHAFGFATRTLSGARTGVTVIPVVVHVVFNTQAQNISDAQVQSQITILNQDYRKTNADVSKTPAVFAPLCADSRIEFTLATKDPNGNPTNGITRTQTSTTSFSDNDKVKSSSTGGADAWPASDYLNLWVCPLGGGLLGYAQFPGGPAATDGVVILSTAFGNTGTAAAPFNLGRTATHEVGHWLNLRHIWGDDGGGCSGDDFVADTPNCGDHNFGKPVFPHVTCNNGPNGDLFVNYMDYTDDDSMFMFTNGQVVRMQACLDGDRSTIGHTKSGPTLSIADLTTVATIDATVATIDHPTLATLDHATIAAADQPTLALADHPTIAAVDIHTTIAAIDHPQTLALLDHPTLAAGDLPTVATHDVAGPTGPGPIGDPGPLLGGGIGGRHVPFVLSTPHHTTAWQRSFPDMAQQQVQQLAAQISQYQQVLNDYAAAEAAGTLSTVDSVRAEQLTAEYNALIAEYRQLTGA
jgi:hypothetical protein